LKKNKNKRKMNQENSNKNKTIISKIKNKIKKSREII